MNTIPIIITSPVIKSTDENFRDLLKIGLRKLVKRAVDDKHISATDIVEVLIE